VPQGPRARSALHQHAPRSCPHAPEEGPHRRRPPRARGRARGEGAEQSRGLGYQGRAAGQGHPRRDQGALLTRRRPPVTIGRLIRTLTRHAPRWRTTALAVVAGERADPFRVLIACLLSLRTKDETTGPAS